MPNSPTPQNNDSSLPGYQPLTATEAHWWLMWGLLFIGVLLVLSAEAIGVRLVQEKYAPNSYGWSPDKARAVALTIRCLGVMCFAAGLVERVVIQISKLTAQ